MSDLPERNAEAYLDDGLYVSFDGWYIKLRAPRIEGDHFVSLEPDTYRSLIGWIASYPALWEHLKGRRYNVTYDRSVS